MVDSAPSLSKAWALAHMVDLDTGAPSTQRRGQAEFPRFDHQALHRRQLPATSRRGPERWRRPVYAVGSRSDGALDGNLVLLGSGDFIMGGRGVLDGKLEYTEPDHVYWYAVPTVQPVRPTRWPGWTSWPAR